MKKIVSILTVLMMILTCTALAEVELTMQGNAQLIVPADTATITISVCVSDESAAQAQAAANEKLTTIQAACIDAGVAKENISVDCIRVNVYDDSYSSDYIDGSTKKYEASTTITVCVNDMDLAGKAIDAAINAGADSIYGASFSLSDPQAYHSEVMHAAVSNARAKAETLAAELGVTITGVKCVTETYSDSYESSTGVTTEYASKDNSVKTDVGVANVVIYETLQITFIAE